MASLATPSQSSVPIPAGSRVTVPVKVTSVPNRASSAGATSMSVRVGQSALGGRVRSPPRVIVKECPPPANKSLTLLATTLSHVGVTGTAGTLKSGSRNVTRLVLAL